MVLPASGQISFNDIRIELNVGGQSPFSLESASKGLYVPLNPASPSAPNSTAPYAVSEWYSYQHCISVGSVKYKSTAGAPATPNECNPGEYDAGPTTLYSDNCGAIAVNCKLYQNSTCTAAAAGLLTYFTDTSLGTNSYGQIDGNSIVTSWNVSGCVD